MKKAKKMYVWGDAWDTYISAKKPANEYDPYLFAFCRHGFKRATGIAPHTGTCREVKITFGAVKKIA